MFMCVCESLLFFQIGEKKILVLTFMLSIYSCYPCFSSCKRGKKKEKPKKQNKTKQNKNKNKKQNKTKYSTGAKNNGSFRRFFFFLEIEKKNKQTKVGRFFKGRSGYGKQTIFFMPYPSPQNVV